MHALEEITVGRVLARTDLKSGLFDAPYDERGLPLALPLMMRDRIEIDPKSGCWIWLGAKDRNGYGRVRPPKGGPITSKRLGAHRVAYVLTGGEIGPRQMLDHLCRVRRCINPFHLEPVTLKENTRRGAGAKLTEESIKAIFVLTAAGWNTHSIACALRVSPDHIRHLRGSGKYAWVEVAEVARKEAEHTPFLPSTLFKTKLDLAALAALAAAPPEGMVPRA